MIRALTIAWKDTRLAYRDVAGLAMMFIAPLVLAAVLGAAFGSGDAFSITAVKTVVVNQDAGAGSSMRETGGASAGAAPGGAAPAGPTTAGGISAGGISAGAAILGALCDPDLAGLLTVTEMDDPEAARAAVERGDAGVAVIIPAGVSKALTATQSSPAPTEVRVQTDPTLSVGPSLVTTVVESIVLSLNGVRAAGGAAAQLTEQLGVTDAARINDAAAKAATSFAEALQAAPSVALESRNPQVPHVDAQKQPNVASQVLIGMMLFFMLFGAATPARSILDEHRQGTLPRLFTTPTPRGVILGGKYIAVFLIVLIQAIVLLLAGWLLLGADWGEPGPVAVLTVCSALVAASLGLVTVSFAKTPGQAGAVSSAVFVFLGLISGNFTGTAYVGETFAAVRRVSPLGWLMEAWGELQFGGSWANIALPVAAALAFTVGFFTLAAFLFRRRYA